ncbi:MAG: hypothetical protein EXS46_01995 [Candidatus Taylorbacteria bacterium]|nr:hypothetical protein [Candidatus Taylorbacteria bacterium]
MNSTAVSVIIAAIMIGGAIVLIGGSSTSNQPVANVHNVSMEQGKQVVELRAKGGFAPRTSSAKSGVPTVLRLNTDGTFDCSSSVRIPSLGISKILPATGTTEIDLGAQPKGTLSGTCGMGMYPFEIVFGA